MLRVHCGEALAQSVEEVLIEQGKSYSHSYLTGRTSLFFRAYNWPGQLPPITAVYRQSAHPLSCLDGKKELGRGEGGGGINSIVTYFLPAWGVPSILNNYT